MVDNRYGVRAHGKQSVCSKVPSKCIGVLTMHVSYKLGDVLNDSK